MSKLSDWIEANTVLTQEKLDENDITLNDSIRELFFEQIEDLAFSSELVSTHNGKRTYKISLRLDYPRKTETPFSFLFETGSKTVVPQYTITHRVYKAPVNSHEYEVLSNLECFLIQNPSNATKSNPMKQRNRLKSFISIQGYRQDDVVQFTDVNTYDADGKFVLYYKEPKKEMVRIAYQHGNDLFHFLPQFNEMRLSSQLVDTESRRKNFFLYNIPDAFENANFFLEAEF